jgi:hypothetical protein
MAGPSDPVAKTPLLQPDGVHAPPLDAAVFGRPTGWPPVSLVEYACS